MLIPQFSLRSLLMAMTGCAFISMIVAAGIRGSPVWIYVSVGFGAVVVLLAVQLAMFMAVGLIAYLTRPAAVKTREPGGPDAAPGPKGTVPLAVLLLALALTGRTWAASPGATTTAATATLSLLDAVSQDGIRLQVWVPELRGPGYWPGVIRATPTPATIGDHRLEVEILLRRGNTNQVGFDLAISRELILPAGSAAVEVEVAVPWIVRANEYSIRARDNGQSDPAFERGWTMLPTATSNAAAAMLLPTILTAREDGAVDAKHLLDVFMEGDGQFQGMVRSMGGNISLSAAGLGLADFPRRWRNLSGYDVVYLSVDSLDALYDQHPEAFEALLEWVEAGGNLWVHNVGRQWEKLANVERLLRLPAGGPSAGATPALWTAADPLTFNEPWSRPPCIVNYGYYGQSVSDQKPPKSPSAEEIRRRFGFLLRDVGLGQVAVFAEAPFPGSRQRWAWILNTIGDKRYLWVQRHGLAIDSPNADFWDFLIPGIGAPPVHTFWVLMTLFVAAIGPLNYWLLRRRRRLHLLLLTVPAGAALTTLLFVVCALMADGFSTRVRVRSVTWLDQRRQQAACWTRLSYYAALTQGGGLVFPHDTAVYPLEPFQGGLRPEINEYRTLPYGDDQYRLKNNWIPARTPSQFISVRSRPSKLRLIVGEGTAAGGGLQVENALGTAVKLLVLRDKKGQFYQSSQEIAAGRQAGLQAVTANNAADLLGAAARAERTVTPAGLQVAANPSGPAVRYRNSRYWSPWGIALETRQGTSRLEQTLDVCGLTGQRLGERLPPGSYVAVVAHSPEVSLGMSAAEEHSFEVIVGQW